MSGTAQNSNQLGDKFVINIITLADGTHAVRSIELIDEAKRLRFSFSQDNTLREIFTSEGVAALQEVIDKSKRQPGLMMLPDHKVNLGDLALEGCRIMVTAAEAGAENIMIRWRSYYGRIVSFFKDTFSYRDCIVENATEHALEVMQDVYAPLFDISRFIDAMPTQDLSGDQANVNVALNELNRRIKDLRYYEFLVKRYVATQEGGPALPGLQHDMITEGRLQVDRSFAPQMKLAAIE